MLNNCPIQHNQSDLDRILNTVKARKNLHKFEEVSFDNLVELIQGIQSLTKDKNTIDLMHSKRLSPSRTKIRYELPKAKADKKLADALEIAEAAYDEDLQVKQSQWLDAQLKIALEEERLVEQHLQAEAEKAFKNKLLQQYKESKNAV